MLCSWVKLQTSGSNALEGSTNDLSLGSITQLKNGLVTLHTILLIDSMIVLAKVETKLGFIKQDISLFSFSLGSMHQLKINASDFFVAYTVCGCSATQR